MEQNEYVVLERIRAELHARHQEWYVEFDRAREDSRIRYEDLVARHEQLIEEFEHVRRSMAAGSTASTPRSKTIGR